MFTALTFNMQNGEPWIGPEAPPPPADLAGTCAFLQSCNADVIFLQEVERGHDGGEQAQPPPHYAALQDALPGYDSAFAYPPQNPDEIPFGLGLAIFSRTPIEGFWEENLEAPDIIFEYGGRTRKPSQRLLVGARTQIGDRSLGLLNTHLQAFFMIGASADQYPQQRRRVLSRLAAEPQPVIAAGDFNCAPEENLIGEFAARGFRSVLDSEITWRRRPYCLDHIFYGDALVLEEKRVIPTTVSDHHAVMARFSFAR